MELCIYHRDSIVHVIRDQFLNELYRLYDEEDVQGLINHFHARIFFATLFKIFWLAKIIALPLCLRAIHTHPYVTRVQFNDTTHVNGTGSMDPPSSGDIPYNETLIKTLYYTGLFYGTETLLT